MRAAEDILFRTANTLHYLNLQLQPLDLLRYSEFTEEEPSLVEENTEQREDVVSQPRFSTKSISTEQLFWSDHFARFVHHLKCYPGTSFIRLQWLDYTSTLRLRVLPIKHAQELFKDKKFVGMSKDVLGFLQNDHKTPGFGSSGEYALYPWFHTLKQLQFGHGKEYSVVQCDLREKDGSLIPICPRSGLRQVVEMGSKAGTEILVGFKVEVVFMKYNVTNDTTSFRGDAPTIRHAWSVPCGVHGPAMMPIIESILVTLRKANIELEQWYPKSAPGQYKFVLPSQSPVAAVDTLLMTREIISSVAAQYSLKATFVPKPFPDSCGTGAHMQMSITQGATNYEAFYAGVLKHLPGLIAFGYPHEGSYERMRDAGGRWVAWGSQNRETPLRKIEESHWEIRCIDGCARMYLMVAGFLGAGIQAIKDGERFTMVECSVDPTTIGPAERNALGIQKSMPDSLSEAIGALEADEELVNIIGKQVVEIYCSVKTAENEMLSSMDKDVRRDWLMERF